MKTREEIGRALLLGALCSCAAVRESETHATETTPPSPTVRIEHHEAPTVPALRDRPFRPTGSACTLAYRSAAAGQAEGIRCEVARTDGLLRVQCGGQEWLYERNPVFPEELTGFRVEPGQQKLVAYPFSDLVLEGQARSWSSLARLGIDPDELARLHRSGESLVAFGVRFEELLDLSAAGSALRRVYWSGEQQLPLRAERASGWRIELESLELGRPPLAAGRACELHPDFAVQDVSDWREAVHDHAGSAAHP